MTLARFKRISVVGLGYIGLPTAAMFASRQMEVVGVDVNQHVIDSINGGEVHIVEPQLDIAVADAVKRGYLRATAVPEPADAFLITVPTPFKGGDRKPDLSFIEAAARAISPVLETGNLVVLESTSPVGATEAMARWLAYARPDLTFPQTDGESSDVRVAHCPERVLPGKVMQELVTNDRIIGGMTALCSAAAMELYQIFVTGECVIASTPRLAEMAKLAENSFRDVNIAFANELSQICSRLDMDVWELISLANRHPRVDILFPGAGVGGHCIAVDPWFIVASAPDESRLIRVARQVNDEKQRWVERKALEAVDKKLATEGLGEDDPLYVACYGITFKPDIDDMRESPAKKTAEFLARDPRVNLLIIEPNIDCLPEGLDAASLVTLEEALCLARVHIILVAHSQFATMDYPAGTVVDVVGLFSND